MLPYSQHLHRLPAYLQQADMESNGKSVRRDGARRLRHRTDRLGRVRDQRPARVLPAAAPGHRAGASRFPGRRRSLTPLGDHHDKLLANFFAQTEALAFGKTAEEVRAESERQSGGALDALVPHKVFEGNRPTNSILFRRLDPATLGKLIALYEHKIFTQGVLWDINSFDQWGVELGKQLAKVILPQLAGRAPIASHDSSTNGLINHMKARAPPADRCHGHHHRRRSACPDHYARCAAPRSSTS